MTSKFVVHCRKWPYDVYIGRPSLAIRRDIPGSDGRWGNPWEMDTPKEKKDGTREEVIVYHKTWLLLDKECKPDECSGSVPKPKNYSVWQWKFTNKQLRNQLQTELKAKVLGCWCGPLPCRGDTLTELANSVNAMNHRTTTVSSPKLDRYLCPW